MGWGTQEIPPEGPSLGDPFGDPSPSGTSPIYGSGTTGYQNAYLDPQYESGSLGGYGMQDLYSQYVEYGYLMGSDSSFNPDPYDLTQENLLRKKYREDYLDFTRGIKDTYAQGMNQRAGLAGKIGRSGFAGSGRNSLEDFQSGVAADIKNRRLGIAETQRGALDAISGLRQDYSTGLSGLYGDFLSAQPDDWSNPDASTIENCHNAPGMVWDGSNCVAIGTMPEEWTDMAGWGTDPTYAEDTGFEEGFQTTEDDNPCGYGLYQDYGQCASGCMTANHQCADANLNDDGTPVSQDDSWSFYCDDPVFAANMPDLCGG